MQSHQRDGAEKIIIEKKGGICFAPGGGKTPTAIVVCAEALARGTVKKPLIVVPANTIEQWINTAKDLYPNHTIYEFPKNKQGVAKEWKNLSADDKIKIAYDLKNNRYDFVIVADTFLKRLGLKEETLEKYADELTKSMESLEANAKSKEITSFENKRKAVLEGLKAQYKDTIANFEDLGFDAIYADEAQMYKNIGYALKDTQRNLGSSISFKTAERTNEEGVTYDTKILNSFRAYDFRFKANYISSNNNGNNVVLITGTPIANKPLELYTFLQHMDNNILQEYGIFNANDFINMFFEVRPVQYPSEKRAQYRVHALPNLGLLTQIRNRYVNYKGFEDMPELPRPGALAEPHVLHLTPSAERLWVDWANRVEMATNFHSKEEIKGVDYEDILSLQNLGRAMSVDICFYEAAKIDIKGALKKEEVNALKIQDEKERNLSNNKIKKVAELITQRTKENPKAGQLLFCDRLNYEDVNGVLQVLHQDIKNELLASSLYKNEEIAIITGQYYTNHKTGEDKKGVISNKELMEIQRKFNAGDIKIILGNTSKVGVGVDLHTNTTDVHQLDIPYRPDEKEQRDNRAVRQGNTNAEVVVHSYIQEGTTDLLYYTAINGKEGWMSVILKNTDESIKRVEIDHEIKIESEDMLIATKKDVYEKQVYIFKKELKELNTKINEALQLKQNLENENIKLEENINNALQEEIKKYEDALKKENFPKWENLDAKDISKAKDQVKAKEKEEQKAKQKELKIQEYIARCEKYLNNAKERLQDAKEKKEANTKRLLKLDDDIQNHKQRGVYIQTNFMMTGRDNISINKIMQHYPNKKQLEEEQIKAGYGNKINTQNKPEQKVGKNKQTLEDRENTNKQDTLLMERSGILSNTDKSPLEQKHTKINISNHTLNLKQTLKEINSADEVIINSEEVTTKQSTNPTPTSSLVDNENISNETLNFKKSNEAMSNNPKILHKQPSIRPQSGTILLGDKEIKLSTKENPMTAQRILSQVVNLVGRGLYFNGISKKSQQSGWYKRATGELRIKEENDVEAYAHEMAHYLDFYGGSNVFKKAYKDVRFKTEVESFSYTKDKDKRGFEGFAEYVRAWLTQYDFAKTKAPNFTKEFERIIKEHHIKNKPNFQKDLYKLQESMHDYYNQGDEALYSSNIGNKLPPKERFLNNIFQTKETIKQQLGIVNTLDRTHGFSLVEFSLFGKLKDASKSATKLLRLALHGYNATYEAVVKWGTPKIDENGGMTFAGRGLKDIFDPVLKKGSKEDQQNFKELMEYFAAVQANEMIKQNKEVPFSKSQIDTILKRADEKPIYKKVFDDYQKFNDQMLEFYVQCNYLRPQDVENFKKINKVYVPMQRVVENMGQKDGASGGFLARLGSFKNIQDIEQNITEQLAYHIRAAMMANAKSKLFSQLNNHKNGSLLAVRLAPDSKELKVHLEQQASKFAELLYEKDLYINKQGDIAELDSSVNFAEAVAR